MRCPCRKKSETTDYTNCCAPYHAGSKVAPTAEALMRSRYSAYVVKNASYVLSSWHPSTRPTDIPFIAGQEWLQLRIVATATEPGGDRATVEFVARSRIGGKTHVLHETSRFVRENGRWLYVDGVLK